MLMTLLACPSFFFRKIHSHAARPDASLPDALDIEAQAGDPSGIHAYCGHLVRLLVGDRRLGKHFNSLTDRLSRSVGHGSSSSSKNNLPILRSSQFLETEECVL